MSRPRLRQVPPGGALVLAVDEKPSIQALERAQGYLKLPYGRALTGQSHDYKRHGTTTLFAALNVASGEVHAKHYSRRRRIEFLDFMNRIVAEHPKRQIVFRRIGGRLPRATRRFELSKARAHPAEGAARSQEHEPEQVHKHQGRQGKG